MSLRLKIIIITLALALLIGLILLFSGSNKGTAKLNITASDPAAIITIFRINPTPGQVDTKNATGKYSAELPTGIYSLTATSKLSSVQRTIMLSKGNQVTVALTLSNPATPELVASVNALNPISSGQSLRYLDSSNGSVDEITSQNRIQHLGTVSGLSNVLWGSPTFGLASSPSGNLYLIQDSSITLVTLPFPINPTSFSFAPAPNQEFYVSDGSKVYRSGTNRDFQVIYKSPLTVTIKAASNNSVLLQESDPVARKKDNSLLTVDRKGDTHQTDGEAYNASFSPSGNKVLLNGDERSAILDSSMKEIIHLPINNVTPPAWLDDDTLIYAFQSRVWKFNVQTGSATELADTGAAAVVQQTIAADGSYVYLTTQNATDGKNPDIKRFGLKNQPVSSPITILSMILPNTVSNCQLSFINFTAPTVTIQGPKAQQAPCTAAAQKYLQTYHVDTKAIGLSFSAF